MHSMRKVSLRVQKNFPLEDNANCILSARSVLSLMQAALDAVPLLAAAPGVAASIAGTLAAWC
jgi:hypothetical protein